MWGAPVQLLQTSVKVDPKLHRHEGVREKCSINVRHPRAAARREDMRVALSCCVLGSPLQGRTRCSRDKGRVDVAMEMTEPGRVILGMTSPHLQEATRHQGPCTYPSSHLGS